MERKKKKKKNCPSDKYRTNFLIVKSPENRKGDEDSFRIRFKVLSCVGKNPRKSELRKIVQALKENVPMKTKRGKTTG